MGNETIRFIFEAIFLGFGLCSILVFILSFFTNSDFKNTLASYFNYGTVIIRIFGIVYLVYYLITMIYFYSTIDSSNYIDRATGPYAWAYWYMVLRPIVYCMLTQLLWFKTLRAINIRSLLLVLLFSFITIASGPNIERYVIVITTIHRDYLPNTWNNWESQPNLGQAISALFLLIKAIAVHVAIFSALVGITWFIDKKIIKIRNS